MVGPELISARCYIQDTLSRIVKKKKTIYGHTGFSVDVIHKCGQKRQSNGLYRILALLLPFRSRNCHYASRWYKAANNNIQEPTPRDELIQQTVAISSP